MLLHALFIDLGPYSNSRVFSKFFNDDGTLRLYAPDLTTRWRGDESNRIFKAALGVDEIAPVSPKQASLVCPAVLYHYARATYTMAGITIIIYPINYFGRESLVSVRRSPTFINDSCSFVFILSRWDFRVSLLSGLAPRYLTSVSTLRCAQKRWSFLIPNLLSRSTFQQS